VKLSKHIVIILALLIVCITLASLYFLHISSNEQKNHRLHLIAKNIPHVSCNKHCLTFQLTPSPVTGDTIVTGVSLTITDMQLGYGAMYWGGQTQPMVTITYVVTNNSRPLIALDNFFHIEVYCCGEWWRFSDFMIFSNISTIRYASPGREHEFSNRFFSDYFALFDTYRLVKPISPTGIRPHDFSEPHHLTAEFTLD